MTDKEHELDRIARELGGFHVAQNQNDESHHNGKDWGLFCNMIDSYSFLEAATKDLLLAKLRAIVGKESIRCDKCQCIVCPPIKCMSCISDAPQESRDINRNLTEQNEALTQRIAELEKELQAIRERDATMYDFRAHIEYIEKEIEAAEKRGFEAVKSKVIDAMAIDIAADHPSKDGYDEALFSINSVAHYLDDAFADYKKSLKG